MKLPVVPNKERGLPRFFCLAILKKYFSQNESNLQHNVARALNINIKFLLRKKQIEKENERERAREREREKQKENREKRNREAVGKCFFFLLGLFSLPSFTSLA